VAEGPAAAAPERAETGAARGYLRGSSLLLGGRLLAVVVNCAVQVLTVRFLSKSDYGAFAYALGIVTLGSQVALAGLGKTIARLAPIYLEQRDHARTFGMIALATGTVLGLGMSLVVSLHGFHAVIGDLAGADPQSVSLLLILIALAPVEAFDHVLQQLVAVFAGARPIFVRRQVMGPLFKLATVIGVMLISGDVHMLAYGYVVGGLLGVALYLTVLLRVWRSAGLLAFLRPDSMSVPVRETFGFSLPLLSSELSIVLRGSAAVILIEYYMATQEVAEYRAVLPVAGLNMLVAEAFGLLFVPMASRMFARSDHAGVNTLYWQACLWIAVLTFPILAITCALAGEVTVWLFGPTYQEAGVLLSLLAAGYYFNAALGFNAATLRVYGRLKTIVANDLIAAVWCIVTGVVLIRRYGALGAAMSTTGTLVLQNILNHVGLWSGRTGVRLFEPAFLPAYAVITLSILALLIADWLGSLPALLDLLMAIAASAAVLLVARPLLHTEATLPELLRIPLLRLLLAVPVRGSRG
jgi:O-antigen/teichoic acid export membrane protein